MNNTTTLSPGYILHGANHKYEILRVLGQGTFGITYLAQTRVQVEGPLGQLESIMQVAVKEFFMREVNGREGSTVTTGSDGQLYADYCRKFRNEAQHLSQLHHPGIVRVLEAFDQNGTVYYVMENLPGGSLDARIGSKGLPEEEAVRHARRIGEALKFMHGQKMLHLDLKPGNIMLDKDGNAVLIDFGLSKQYTAGGDPESSTSIGAGTPGYAPIEQANYQDGKDFPVTMDIYALGGTLFKMLTGQRPPAASEILNDGFPTSVLEQHNVSPRLIDVVRKAMMPIKKDRYQHVDQLLAALGEDEASESTVAAIVPPTPKPASEPEQVSLSEAKPKPAPKSNKKWIAALVILCVAGIIAAFALIVYPSLKESNNEEEEDWTETEVVDDMEHEDYRNRSTHVLPPPPSEVPQTPEILEIIDSAEMESDANEVIYIEEDHIKANSQSSSPSYTDTAADSVAVDLPPVAVEEEVEDNTIYDAVEQYAVFSDGNIYDWFAKNLRYPTISLENGIQGRVIVEFIIERDGSVSNVRAIRSPDSNLSNEAVRLIKSMPKWKPARQDGKPVRQKQALPITFRLQ